MLEVADGCYERTSHAGVFAELGPIRDDEHDQLFAIFFDVVANGEGYPHAPPLSRETYATTFAGPSTTSTVARVDGRIVGGYYLKPNFIGKAAHIANAGYLVAPEFRSRGVGRLFVEDSIERSPLLGFDAIQFNLVFASNPARSLYRDLGWREIGIVPRAVGDEDAVIYHRFVGPDSNADT
jgi:GNAT superfamily N-acetyltransferase